jgi:hypothetical protein
MLRLCEGAEKSKDEDKEDKLKFKGRSKDQEPRKGPSRKGGNE